MCVCLGCGGVVVALGAGLHTSVSSQAPLPHATHHDTHATPRHAMSGWQAGWCASQPHIPHPTAPLAACMGGCIGKQRRGGGPGASGVR